MQNKLDLHILVPLLLLLQGIVALIVDHVLIGIPLNRLALIMATVFLISVTSVYIGFLLFRGTFDLVGHAREIKSALETLQEIGLSPITNEHLKGFERDAARVRIVTPDLEDDYDEFAQTVRDNLASHKTYEYIIPAHLSDKMNRLVQDIRHDLKLAEDHPIPIHYSIWTASPIINEYMVYSAPGHGNLKAFVEVRAVDLFRTKTTNYRLNDNEAVALNAWFDRVMAGEGRADAN